MEILVKNRNFGQKLKFWSTMAISKFWSKVEILVNNGNFEILVENQE